uniref:RING-type E3 ubiquitin transferase n=1 Tax=Zea mays TaxID=4577 RepID=A0A804U8W6_MAIZE
MPLCFCICGYAAQCVLHMVCVAIDIAKHLESANTMFSFLWWLIGLYWVSVGGEVLTRDALHLYWLCIVFLAFDVFLLSSVWFWPASLVLLFVAAFLVS